MPEFIHKSAGAVNVTRGSAKTSTSSVAALPDGDAAREILMPGGVSISQKVIDDANVELNDHFQNITEDRMRDALNELCVNKDGKAGRVFLNSKESDPTKYCHRLGPSAIEKLFDADGK